MSSPAEKQPAPSEAVVASEDPSGRFTIDESRRGSTVLPPPGQDADLVALEDVGAVLEIEPEPEREVGASAAPRPIASGVFSAGAARSAPPPPLPAAARRTPSAAPTAGEERSGSYERAQLQLEDLSLRFDNPYAASSLVPPSKEPVSIAKIAGVSVAVAVLAAAGFLILRGMGAEPQPTARAKTAVAPAPVERASAVREATPARVPPASPPSAALATAAPASRPAAAVTPSVQPKPEPVAAPAPAQVATADAPSAQRAQPVSVATTAVAPEVVSTGAVVPPAAVAPVVADVAVAEPVALPKTPSREQVVAGFAAVRDALAQCAAGKHGVAKIEATIASSGRISYALIAGAFQGTAEGSCMARVVRSARFPQFTQPTLKVSFPVTL